MIKIFPVRKIASTKRLSGLIGINDKFLLLFLFLFFGMFFGSMASSPFFCDTKLPAGTMTVILDAAVMFIILFLSTSFVGFLFIPIAVAVRGFVFSAFLSSLTYFSEGIYEAVIFSAVPALLFLPCVFILADCCVSVSASLARQNHYRICGYSYFFPSVFLKMVPFLIADIFYCLYLLPVLS